MALKAIRKHIPRLVKVMNYLVELSWRQERRSWQRKKERKKERGENEVEVGWPGKDVLKLSSPSSSSMEVESLTKDPEDPEDPADLLNPIAGLQTSKNSRYGNEQEESTSTKHSLEEVNATTAASEDGKRKRKKTQRRVRNFPKTLGIRSSGKVIENELLYPLPVRLPTSHLSSCQEARLVHQFTGSVSPVSSAECQPRPVARLPNLYRSALLFCFKFLCQTLTLWNKVQETGCHWSSVLMCRFVH